MDWDTLLGGGGILFFFSTLQSDGTVYNNATFNAVLSYQNGLELNTALVAEANAVFKNDNKEAGIKRFREYIRKDTGGSGFVVSGRIFVDTTKNQADAMSLLVAQDHLGLINGAMELDPTDPTTATFLERII